MNQKILIDTEEAAHAILKYIASEDFDKAKKAIEDNASSGLMSGLALSISVILSKCTKYIYTVQDAPGEEAETGDAMPSEAPVG